LKDISLNIAQGDYFVLLGVSGSGKSVLLETIAGLRQPDHGEIVLNGKDITHKRIQQRGVGIVFQDSAVFPHMSVAKNIGYALKSKPHSDAEIDHLVQKWAKRLDIAELLKRMPASLSGGELKRVALARTLAMEPKILLLDEPLSSLDVLLQFDMMRLLKKLNEEGQTIIHVTHDYHEAYALANRLAVMQDGEIIQQGTPAEVFQNPGNAFVAGLTGRRNYFQCVGCHAVDQAYTIHLSNGMKLISAKPITENGYFYIKEDGILISRTNDKSGALESKISGIFPFPGGLNVLVDAGILLHVHALANNDELLNQQVGESVWVTIDERAIVPVHSD
jgi:ABC-type Fe3+/spermidine/putrescine transport system ATPase subunit